MNRMNEESASSLAGNYARHIFAEEIYESTTRPLNGPECQNCGATVDRVTHVPEFDYMGCDDCMAEAIAQIAREAAHAAMLADAGCTAEEAAAHTRKQITRQQGELFQEVS